MAKNIVSLKIDGNSYSARPFGTCDTAAATAAKVVTCADFSLTTGATIIVKFTYANTASSPTLNVNGTGAKAVHYRGAALASSLYYWAAKDVVEFYYDGTQWNLMDVGNTNSTYANYSFGNGYATCETAAATAAKVVTYQYYNMSKGGIVAIKFTYAVPAESTLNINSKGAKSIYHNGAKITAGVIGAGDIATFVYDGTNYVLLAVDNIMTAAEKTKLAGIASGATANTGTVTSITPGTGLTGTSSDSAITSSGTINLKSAATGEIGGIKVGTVNSSAVTTKTEGSNYYPVNIDSNGKGYVALPTWSNNSGTITGATAGNGLTGGGTSGSVTLNVGAGTGISVGTDTVSCNLNSTTSLGTIGSTSKLYAVGVDVNGKLCVNVPWSDNNTNYYPTTFTWTNGTSSAGPTGSLTGSGMSAVSFGAIPSATTSIYGVTKLSSATNSTSTSLAATASAVKAAYDLAYSKASTAYSQITIEDGDYTHNMSASGPADGFTLTAGSNINMIYDAGRIQVSATLPTASSSTLGGVKIGSNISVSSGTISLTKANVTNALGYTPPTTSAATTNAAGLMSAADKSYLNFLSTNVINSSARVLTSASITGDHSSATLSFGTVNRDNDGSVMNESIDVELPIASYDSANGDKAGLMSAADKHKLDNINIGLGACTTAAATAAKVVNMASTGGWVDTVGSIIYVQCSYTNTANNPTLNVNGTGAKPIYYNGYQITTSNKSYATYAGRLMRFICAGDYYMFAGWDIDNNSTYANYSFGNGYATCATAAATAAKVATYANYSLQTGGIVAVKFTYAVPANSTLNINSKGAKSIYYNGAKITANIIGAGDIATFIYDGTNYVLLAVDSAFRTATTSKKGLMSAEDKDKLSHLDAPYPNGEDGDNYSIITDFSNDNGQYIVNLDEWADMGYLYNRGLYLLEANEYSDIDGDSHCAILFVYKPLDDGGSLVLSQKNGSGTTMTLSLTNNNLQFNNSDGSGDFTLREINTKLMYL